MRCPWAGLVTVLDTADSTNTQARVLAEAGAPHGTVVLADRQTGGRGRLGRRFDSPAGLGLYLSLVLRPAAPAGELPPLTALAAVAVCSAVEAVAGRRPGIKWVNDLVLDGRKLGGILTELSIDADSGAARYAVVGIGINCAQWADDFPPELRETATSLTLACGREVGRETLAAAVIRELERMDRALSAGYADWLAAYASDCLTIGHEVKLLRGGTSRRARALGIDSKAALLVEYEDGSRETVDSGEVSVRGLYGYV